MDWYVCGLLRQGGRKSIAPLAARLCPDPAQADAMRQRLQQAVVVARWEQTLLSRRLRERMERELRELGGLEADVCNDTGLPKHGPHSVGVVRQYAGTLGRVDLCQVVVSLHSTGPQGSYCQGMRLYLPESWAEDPVRRKKAGVPDSIAFAPKRRLVLERLDGAHTDATPRRPLIGNAGYGDVAQLRRALNQRQIPYVMEVMSTPLQRLVYVAMLRWRVTRDYHEPTEELGLDHSEGRTWAGLHHHLVLCTVAHSFLMLQRAKWQAAQLSEAIQQEPSVSGNQAAGSRRRKRSPRSRRSRPNAAAQRPTRHWTLAEVCRRLQSLLLRWIGFRPLCCRRLDPDTPRLGVSRM